MQLIKKRFFKIAVILLLAILTVYIFKINSEVTIPINCKEIDRLRLLLKNKNTKNYWSVKYLWDG